MSNTITIKDKVLNRILKINNLTLEQFANNLGVSYNYIRRITSTAVLSKKIVKKIADYYFVDVNKFTEILTTGIIDIDFISKLTDKNEKKKKFFLLETFNNIEDLEDRIAVYKLLEVFIIKKELKENKDNLKNDFDIFNYQKQQEDYNNYITSLIEYLKNLLK